MSISYFNQYQLPNKTFETKEDDYEDDVRNNNLKNIFINFFYFYENLKIV